MEIVNFVCLIDLFKKKCLIKFCVINKFIVKIYKFVLKLV